MLLSTFWNILVRRGVFWGNWSAMPTNLEMQFIEQVPSGDSNPIRAPSFGDRILKSGRSGSGEQKNQVGGKLDFC